MSSTKLNEEFDDFFAPLNILTPVSIKNIASENTSLKRNILATGNIESARLLKSKKHIEPSCYQYVQKINHNPDWEPYKIDVPFYDISAYSPGCGTFRSIFCCLFCIGCGDCQRYGGCYFYDDDPMCFDIDDDKVISRKDALEIMHIINGEKFEHYANHPENREEFFSTVYGGYYEGNFLGRTKKVKEYERNLKAIGTNFVAFDLDID